MPRLVLFSLLTTLTAVLAGPSIAVETITFTDKGGEKRDVVGKILVQAQNGGVLLHGDDNRIWEVQPQQIIVRSADNQDFEPVGQKEVEKRLRAELPGFDVLKTDNYVIVYNSDLKYARRVGGLFENLHRNFLIFWKNQHWKLSEPRYPLVAVVLRDRKAFLKHARAEIGDMADNVIGYYDFTHSNRMTTYNVERDWERNVATIIHEATHQLAFNCGLQTRLADNPLWVSEGLATFFEAPDMRRPGKWRNVGEVNRVNLNQWMTFVRNRPNDSLTTLLADDSRFNTGATRKDAYAESWAFTYFLIKTHRKGYVSYMKALSAGKPLAELTAKQRIEMFETACETSLGDINKKFLDYMARVVTANRVQIGVRPMR